MDAIRPAKSDDAPAIRAMIARIYQDYAYVFDLEREEPHLIDPCAYFRAGGGEIWVAEVDGTIAASAGVLIRPPPAHEAEIKTVYVAHEFRRRGLARRLVSLALDHARAAGRPRVMLWSDTRFIEAHRLYESMGFVRTGWRDQQIVNTFSEYRYDLTLA